MDRVWRKKLNANVLHFKRALDRIAEKFSQPEYLGNGSEVDMATTNVRALARYMSNSQVDLSKLESESLTDLTEEPLREEDKTAHSQLDLADEDNGDVDETSSVSNHSSTSHFSMEDDGMSEVDTTGLTVRAINVSKRDVSVVDFLPEDQDEQLEVSLRSNGNSLMELYPSVIGRLGLAWQRQHVSEAADQVLWRYRRWRQQPKRNHLNNTFVIQKCCNPKKMSQMLPIESSHSPVKTQYVGTVAVARSPFKTANNGQDWYTRQPSPRKVRGEQQQPILVMDLSGSSEPSLSETFRVPQLGEQQPTYTLSPSRSFLDMSVRSKKRSLTAHSPQTDGCSMYVSQITAVKERPDIYGSPVRQSPRKARVLSRSPYDFSRSPRAHSLECFSREPMRPRSTSLSSPTHRPAVPLRMLHHQDSHHSFQSQLPSPQSATSAAAAGRHRLRRHLSFDSAPPPSTSIPYSPKQLDDEFIKLYHKFVCQNKSFRSLYDGPPCRFCARNSEASRGHFSTSLAALALSPHRSLLRKRHRVLSWDSHPPSKRSRDEYSVSSPGSQRYEMLRRRVATSENELTHDQFSYSLSKHSMFQRSNTQQRSADAHEETWMSRGCDESAAEFSGRGGSLQSKMTNSYSPSMCRKWW